MPPRVDEPYHDAVQAKTDFYVAEHTKVDKELGAIVQKDFVGVEREERNRQLDGIIETTKVDHEVVARLAALDIEPNQLAEQIDRHFRALEEEERKAALLV